MRLFITLLMIISSMSISAQETNFGVRGGLNFSNFFASEPDDTNLRTGFNLALTTRASLVEDVLYLKSELGYSGKGSRVESSLGDANLNLGYVDLPLMMSVGFADLIYIDAGAYLGYLASASVSGETSGGSSFNESISRSDFSKIDYGWVLGANLELNPFVVGIRYNYGLQNIIDNDVADFLGTRARNSVFQIYVGFSF